MPTLDTLLQHLEKLAPESYQESYDNAGLLLGNPEASITGVLTSLDITLDVLKEAVTHECNLIVSHHPLLFNPVKKFENIHSHHCLTYAIKHDLAIYTTHTNLDSVPQGVNHMLALYMGLSDLELLKEAPLRTTVQNESLPTRGFGMVGNLPTSLSPLDFLAHLKSQLDLTCIRHNQLPTNPIRRVALCGGVGISLLPDAIAAEADAFVTADIKYHQFFDAQEKLLLLDIGHYESEIHTKHLLAQYISQKFTKIAARESQVVTNPIHYHV